MIKKTIRQRLLDFYLTQIDNQYRDIKRDLEIEQTCASYNLAECERLQAELRGMSQLKINNKRLEKILRIYERGLPEQVKKAREVLALAWDAPDYAESRTHISRAIIILNMLDDSPPTPPPH